MSERPSLLAPHVERYLLAEAGEQIIDEVVKHPVCMLVPLLITLGGTAVILVAPLAGAWWPLVAAAGLAVAGTGLWRFHARHMDRFVITNLRVFRVAGVCHRHVSTLPLTRVLDITLDQPFGGLVLNYGHFTLESAATDQPLKRITYVADPRRRDRTLQTVIQRANVRALAQAQAYRDT
ncbi:MAG: PH domain-containing protein [Propionibacteriaceae bacterium]|nr:PH domain-containing protein [Propionibacteriaceae bacterium]